CERRMRLRDRGVHDFAMRTRRGRQFDDIAVWVAEIDRADELMVDRTADLPPLHLPLFQHAVERVGFDPERDVQIERILALELKGLAGHLEKGEAGAVIHLKKGMQTAARVDFERTDKAQTEKILVKRPRLLRIPAAISIMMQALNHPCLRL